MPPAERRMPFDVDFNQAPLLVIWEVTRACALACRHCRASAIDVRHPDELTTDQGRALLHEIKTMGTPLVVLTGGDPLQRTDLEDLIRAGKAEGLRVGTIPAGTPRLTRERLASIRDAGVDQVAFSFDAPNAAKHDAFRQVQGSFDLTMQGAKWARELGIPIQVNTVFSNYNKDDFDAMAKLVEDLGIVFWEVFFLVPTGRGTELQACTAGEYEELFAKLYALSKRVDFVVKITEAQHYRRFTMQQQAKEGGARTMPEGPFARHGRIGASTKAVNSGRGFCFVDHVGEVCPSGFLPISAGNVKKDSITAIYRDSDLFRGLRDYSKLKGRCGICEFKNVCGGSRARAYALTGDIYAEDPYCAYQPRELSANKQ